MRERIPCEFFLIRYVPDVVKGEFVNVGIILREVTPRETVPRETVPRETAPRETAPHETAALGPAGRAAAVRFTRDWSRVQCIDANADVELLEGLEPEIAARLEAEVGGLDADRLSVLNVLRDSLSNSVQIAEPRACLAETVALEMDLLMRLYVEPLRVDLAVRPSSERPVVARPGSGRAAIVAAMRQEFERAGVWALMEKRIRAAEYTRPGDPLKIDCGYQPNGVIRMFHAVSLKNDVEGATALAYAAPRLRAGVMRVKAASLTLTAVVEPLRKVSSAGFSDEAAERYRYGVETMEHEQIRVLTVSDLSRAAETARQELRV